MKSLLARALVLGVLAPVSVAASEPRSRAEDPNYEPGEKTPESIFDSPVATEAPVAYFEGEALRAKVPDMVVNRSPGPLRLSGLAGLDYPFLFAGAGLGVEASPVDFLRLWAYYGAGMSGVRDRVGFGQYAEASIGVRVLTFDGTYSTDIEASYRPPGPPVTGERPKVVFRAGLPATHAIFLEAGMLSGAVPRLKCVEECLLISDQSTLLTVNPQLVYPMGGLRYRFFSSVSSRTQAQIDRMFQLELNADVLYQPFNDSREPLLWGDFSSVRGSSFGGFGGFSVRYFGRGSRGLLFGIQGGYLPAPASPMFRLSVGFSA